MSSSDFLPFLRVRPSGLPHGRHRVAPTGALALATTERVVDGVHGHATHVRALALPAVTARLADLDQAGLAVADRADGAPAVDRDAAHLGRREPQGRVLAFLGHQLDRRARAPTELAARTGLQLDVVHGRTDRDVTQRQRVAGPDLRSLPALEHVADLEAQRSDDVALLAVEVVEQRDASVAVRVVLDRRDLGRHAVLVATEVDQAVLLLVTATTVTRRHAAVGVPSTGARLGLGERLLRLVAGDLREVGDGLEPATGTGGLALANRHRQLPKISIRSPSARETIARLASGARAESATAAVALALALAVQRVDVGDPHPEDRLRWRGGSRSCWRHRRRRTCRRSRRTRRRTSPTPPGRMMMSRGFLLVTPHPLPGQRTRSCRRSGRPRPRAWPW